MKPSIHLEVSKGRMNCFFAVAPRNGRAGFSGFLASEFPLLHF